MQDRTRSFLDIKSLFQSSRRPRSPTPAKTYHYKKKKEWSSSGPKQSMVIDEHTTYIIQRTLVDPHLSNETTVFRQLSVREPPASPPPTQQSSLRSPRSSNDSFGVFHSDAMSSADSISTISPAQFPPQPRSASPQLSQRRGGISSPDLTPRLHPSSGLAAPPFTHVTLTQQQQPTQNITPRRLTADKGDISYSRPTPYAYPYVKSRRSYQHQPNRGSVEWQPSPAPAPRVPEPTFEPSFSLHSWGRGGSGRAARATSPGYRDRMLVHASVNKSR